MIAKFYFWKIFALPTPQELGWTTDGSLPMRSFQSIGDDSLTWEDWEEEMQKKYPIRYFLSCTFYYWFISTITRPIKNFFYWLKSHLLPSRRYHILDLRQPSKINGKYNPDEYNWGWADCDHLMLFAIFNLLNLFVKKDFKNFYCPTDEELIKTPSLAQQRNLFIEIKSIHYWWNVERKRAISKIDDVQSKWFKAKSDGTSEFQQLWQDLKVLEKEQEEKTEEMVTRLMKIRRSLWT